MEERVNLAQLLRDLEVIKEATKRNRVVLREVYSPRRLRFFMLYFATAVVLLSLLFQYCVGLFGSYAALPPVVKLLLFAVIAVLGLSIGVLKWVSIDRSAKSVDTKLSMGTILRDHLRPFLVHIYFPFFLLTLGGACFAAASGHAGAIVGIVAIFMALVMNYVGLSVGLADYLVFGYWLLITGVLSLLVPGVAVGIWVAICFGGGSYALVIAAALRERHHPFGSRQG